MMKKSFWGELSLKGNYNCRDHQGSVMLDLIDHKSIYFMIIFINKIFKRVCNNVNQFKGL